MGYLKDKKFYLAGSIEYDGSEKNWRTEPKKILKERFKIDLFDPYEDPKQQWAIDLAQAKENENYDEVKRIAKSFVYKDLGKIDRQDALIAHIDTDIYSFGTNHEIVNANDRKKLTLIMCKQGKKHCPSWPFAFIPHQHIFGKWEDLYNYLQEVDDGKHKGGKRLDFIYGLI